MQPPEARPGWLLDEVASAGRENLDAGHAARYDAIEDAAAGDEVALCVGLGLTSDSTVVEIGPGTGQFTLAVAPLCARVVAADVSPVMLDVLRAKVDRAQGRVDLVQAGFLTYEHEGRPADFVYSRYALHHLPDFWKAIALARIHQMLRPGGVFRLWDITYSFDPAEIEERIESWCSTLEATVVDGWSRGDIEEHVRDEHSTFTWLLEPIIQRSGFSIEDAEYSADGIFAKYVLRRL
ncbi:MAG: methyltransferase domain-containing protein [Dehalococcoidia bacterium]|nr:methyltransferase domain-containing protein [Dehalococcoidia bacterium]